MNFTCHSWSHFSLLVRSCEKAQGVFLFKSHSGRELVQSVRDAVKKISDERKSPDFDLDSLRPPKARLGESVGRLTRNLLLWCHNGLDGVSNHQPHDCLLNRSFRRRSKKTPKLRVIGLCVGNSPVTCEFPAQRASIAENVSIWWRHPDQRVNMLSQDLQSITSQLSIEICYTIIGNMWSSFTTYSSHIPHNQYGELIVEISKPVFIEFRK